ncbi:MAG TPA: hypothetical protein PLS83_05685 [Methanothrix soehngenii]|nr:hypothetical protein [Methanothrix soehngenii]
MTIFSPVPVGAQMAWLSCRSKGIPPDLTLVEALIHWAVTHGPLATEGGGRVHPVTE